MSEEIKPDPKQAPTQDAQLAAENIASGQETPAGVNVEEDYEASKQFSVSDVDRTGAGAEAAQKATGPDRKVPEAEKPKLDAGPDSNPDDYRDMAKDVGPKA
jgi:hypothetical protein